MKRFLTRASLVSLALGLSAPVQAQSEKPFQKLWNLFGGKSNPPANVSSTPTPTQAEANSRPDEILIELAWMADPITFPYQLVATSEKGQLQLHGTVPSRAVKDHALRVARLQTTRKLTDHIQENAGALARAVRVPTQQLQQSTQTALRDTFPQDHGQLKIQTYTDGRVTVTGRVTSWEHKLAVSQALTRVQGASAVANQTQIVPVSTASPAINAPMRPTPNGAQPYFQAMPSGPGGTQPKVTQNAPSPVRVGTPSNNTFQSVSMSKSPTSAPVTLEQPQPGPYVPASPLIPQPRSLAKTPTTGEPARGVVIVDEPTGPAGAATPQLIKRRIEETVPGASDVVVTFTGPKTAKVDIRCRPQDNTDQIIGQIISLRELESIQVDLNIRVPEK